MTDHPQGPVPDDDIPRDLDAFARRAAQPLRAPERLDASFENRVMAAVLTPSAVAAVPAAPSRGWWRRPRTLHVTPLAGLAAAAGIVAIAVGGALGLESRLDAARTATPVVAAAPETVHVVRFVLRDPDARGVSLVGDFNAWSREAAPLAAADAEGTWSVTVTLPRGRHEYAFVVRREDGERWVADPAAPRIRDEFDTESSVVTVGDTHAPRRAS